MCAPPHRLLAIVAGLLLAAALSGCAANSIATVAPTSTATAASTATLILPTATLHPPTPTGAPKVWVTGWHFAGSQSVQSAWLDVPDGSRIVWNEALNNATSNTFIVELFNTDDTLYDVAVNNVNQTTNQSGVYNVKGNGRKGMYFKIGADQVNYVVDVQM
jgi:hypothetical protein